MCYVDDDISIENVDLLFNFRLGLKFVILIML